MLVAMIIAGLFLFAYLVHIIQCGFFFPLIALIIVLVLSIAMPWIAQSVREALARKPKLTSRQVKALAEARLRDEQATQRNAAALAAAQEKHDAALAVRNKELETEIGTLMTTVKKDLTTLQKEFATLEAMDCVGPDEKNLQAVDMLIHFIRTRRADDIKEALHEYDKLLANQQLLELENEKLEIQRQQAIQEHQDRVKQMELQKQHNWEMEFRARCAADENRRIAKQLDYIGYLVHTDVNYNR